MSRPQVMAEMHVATVSVDWMDVIRQVTAFYSNEAAIVCANEGRRPAIPLGSVTRSTGRKFVLAAALCQLLFSASSAWAGGGPENVFLVVNSRSWASRTIANHYIELRNIPPSNILFLDWDGSVERTDIETFRKKILLPIITAIDKNRLGAQIDYVVYSSDFPYEIDFSKEITNNVRFMSASITSLTYLYDLVMEPSKPTSQLGTTCNWYANTSTSSDSTSGFQNQQAWSGPNKKSATTKGRNYMLSTMLGYTSGRGNSIDEIINYLTQSAQADGSLPNGTVYFMQNKDIRTLTRVPYFNAVMSAIRREGGKVELATGTTPLNKSDVIGVSLGTASYNWLNSKSSFLPGAICDNLTSFGGVLRDGAYQTPLSEGLRFGAAAASGTVIEPYAIANKFPHPVIHLHYRRGCSLAEAFYLSVPSPYQLLIVGDPLCQPFARIPNVKVDGIPLDGIVYGQIELSPSVVGSPGRTVARYEVYIDGRLRQTARRGEKLAFNSEAMPDGYHEVRVVAVMNDRVETRGRAVIPIQVANRDRKIKSRLVSPKTIPMNSPVRVDVQAPGANRLVMFSDRQFVAQATGSRETMVIPARRLGLGPVRLMAAGLADEQLDNVFSEPIRFDVVAGPRFAAVPVPVGTTATDGLELMLPVGTTSSVASTAGSKWLTDAGVKPDQPFSLAGYFTVPTTSIHQFQLQFRGDVDLQLDGKSIFRHQDNAKSARYEIPVLLERGGHRLRMSARLKPLKLLFKFGATGTQAIKGPTFKH